MNAAIDELLAFEWKNSYWLTDKYREYRRQYRKRDRDTNREKNLEWERGYRERNRESLNAKAREYYHRNRTKCRARNRDYLKSNADKRRKSRREYLRTNIQARLRSNVGRRIKKFLKNKKRFNASTVGLLGCSLAQFLTHLESKFKLGMTFENYGTAWQIDHIIPCAAFDLQNPVHQKRCFHFSNLQPLWKSENLAKRAKIVTNQFILL